MSTRSKIAFSLALVVGTASAALAAPKHTAHHRGTAVVRQLPAAAYEAYGQAPAAGNNDYGYAIEHGQVKRIQGESGAIMIQDRDWAAHNGKTPEDIW